MNAVANVIRNNILYVPEKKTPENTLIFFFMYVRFGEEKRQKFTAFIDLSFSFSSVTRS